MSKRFSTDELNHAITKLQSGEIEDRYFVMVNCFKANNDGTEFGFILNDKVNIFTREWDDKLQRHIYHSNYAPRSFINLWELLRSYNGIL